MSEKTKISWCDSTINPCMGCGGCELLLSPGKICRDIDAAVKSVSPRWKKGAAKGALSALIAETYAEIGSPQPFHSGELTTTNMWHVRKPFIEAVKQTAGRHAAIAASMAIQRGAACYAAKLHFNRGGSICNTSRKLNSGYTPEFTKIALYPGRVAKMSRKKDLIGTDRPDKPWLDGLARLVFVSDMGDCFSGYDTERRRFLETDVMPSLSSDKGRRHILMWLTKRPNKMAEFASHIGGFPENVCCMTTLVDGSIRSLDRVDQLRKVNAAMRGLSLEPLMARIDPGSLNLEGIDWVIVGGESGNNTARPFDLQWARDIRDVCRRAGVAFFMKQLGRNPMVDGQPYKLVMDKSHGGDWREWPEDLRIREMPRAFRQYRR